MVSSGSCLTNGWYSDAGKDYVYLEFAWSVLSTSIAENSTTIAWELRCKRTSNSKYVWCGGFQVAIDGNTVYKTTTDDRVKLYNGTVVDRGSHTFYHNEMGKRSFSVNIEGAVYYYAVNCWGKGSWELPDLPRQAVITDVQNFTDEQNPIVSYSNHAGDAVEAVMACISLDGTKDDIAYREISKTGTSYTFNLTDEERDILRNATVDSKKRTVQFIILTVINGITLTSVEERTLTIVNASPYLDFYGVTYRDANEAVVAITENDKNIVQGHSHLEVSFAPAIPQKGARIVGYKITVNEKTATTETAEAVNLGVVDSSRNVNLMVTATDSRGNASAVVKPVTVLSWKPPTFTASVERRNNYEDETLITVEASKASVDGKNDVEINYVAKQAGGEYGEPTVIENRKTHIAICDKNYGYDFLITVTDLFGGTASREYSIAKGKFPLFINTERNSVGINEFPEEGEALRVSGGVACFDEGIVLKAGDKHFKITIDESGVLVVTALSQEGETE